MIGIGGIAITGGLATGQLQVAAAGLIPVAIGAALNFYEWASIDDYAIEKSNELLAPLEEVMKQDEELLKQLNQGSCGGQ